VKEGLNQKEIVVDAALLDKFLHKNASPSSRGRNKSDERMEREISALHIALVNGCSMQKAMLDAGYPKSMVTPQSAYNLAHSPSFKELLDFYVPDEVLLERELSLLNSKNPKWVDKSLDRAHKIKGNFQIKVELSAKGDSMKKLTDEELYAIAQDKADIIPGEFEEVPNSKDANQETNEPSRTS